MHKSICFLKQETGASVSGLVGYEQPARRTNAGGGGVVVGGVECFLLESHRGGNGSKLIISDAN